MGNRLFSRPLSFSYRETACRAARPEPEQPGCSRTSVKALRTWSVPGKCFGTHCDRRHKVRLDRLSCLTSLSAWNNKNQRSLFWPSEGTHESWWRTLGCTVLAKGIKKNWLTQRALKWLNAHKLLSNLEDDLGDLKDELAKHFLHSHVKVVGYMAFFRACTPS